ncbi:YIP1 family protein [Clostridium perfringens]
MLKNSLDYLLSPIEMLKKDNKKRCVIYPILFIIFFSIIISIISTKISIDNSIEIKDLLSTNQISKTRLNILLVIISTLKIIFSSLLGYLFLSCIFKIIFIVMGEEIKFYKLIFANYYISCIGLVMTFFNTFLSFILNDKSIELYTNFSFFLTKNNYLKAVLQILDPFIILQFIFLYLFVRKVVNISKVKSIIFVTVYILITFVICILGVVLN